MGLLATGLIATAPDRRATVQWTLKCIDRELKVHEWVDDTRADTTCAVVRIDPWFGSVHEFKTCGSGTRKTFYSTDSADIALFLR
ncbi:hypothetical protein OG230_00375 [Streptomyces sp. NBC_00234]|uniref:hypothetical protein n=1 Tax=Streptomyces sp. NBC_00234 TaxID=2903638 RepID=UPI002E2BF85B|nr:hypothetical protein [Streptomyces sp. NBC_00234]